MSVHVLLNFLNKLGKEIKCEACKTAHSSCYCISCL